MTQKELFAAVRALGLSIKYDAASDEYRIAYRGADSERSAYYTNDRDDALGTAQHMSTARVVAAALSFLQTRKLT